MKNENGRSMVEMLGVLAIIGVLSVGGIVGYTIAMRKYRANEIAHAVSMLAIAAETTRHELTGTEVGYRDLIKDAPIPSGVVSLTAKVANGRFNNEINLEVDDNKLCSAVEDLFGTSSDNILSASGDCSAAPVLTITKN